jgi:diguanylate cyclase (GGDEF)-like protein/PAS domain S-box-containing protein
MPTTRIYELMTTDVITISKDAKLIEAIEKLANHNISSIVVAEGFIPIGIITERDAARIVISEQALDDTPVSKFMVYKPVMVYKNADIITALDIMERNRIRRLIVTDRNKKLAGIITYSDILRKLEEEFFKVHTTVDSITTKEILKTAPDDTLKSVVDRMSAEKKSCMLIVSGESTLGIITERDIVKYLLKKTPLDTPVGSICTRNIIYANRNTLLYEAIKIMNEQGIRHLVVVDEKLQLRGIVTQTDIINLLHDNVTKGIRDQLQRFKESLDMLQTGFIEFELNGKGTILWINKHGARALGFDGVENAIGSSFAILLKNQLQWQEFVSRINSRPTAMTFVFHLKDKVIDCSFRIRQFTVSGIFKDITKMFVESECIRNERDQFEKILKTLSEGLIIYNKDGLIKDINEAALSMLGITKEQAVGQPYYCQDFAFIDENDNSLSRDDMTVCRVLKTGIPEKNVIRGIRKRNGSALWFTESVIPLFNENNNENRQENGLEEIIHVLADITEIYNLQETNKKILETAKEGYWEMRLDGEILNVNKALSGLLGYSRDELINKSIYDLVDENNKRIFEQALMRRRQGISESYEITLKHKNGSDVYTIISASPRKDVFGKVQGAFAFITDITDIKSTHNMLHAIASFYRDISRALSEKEAYEIFTHYLLSLRKGNSGINAVYLVNIDHDNRKAEDVVSFNDSGGHEVSGFPGLDHCKSYIYAGNFIVNDISKEYTCPYRRLKAKAGSHGCFSMNIGGSIGGILQLYSRQPNFFTEEIKETIESFTALFATAINNMRLIELNRNLALIDSLTGLYNRRYLDTFIDKQLALAERNKQPLSIIILDIDNFKHFNDTNGHKAGDMALRSISQAINKNIRVSDIGVRYGGEEFIIVLPNIDKVTAFEVAERIRYSIEMSPITISRDKKVFITSSFGIATYDVDGDSFDALIANADNALYNAKKAGKNRICLA